MAPLESIIFFSNKSDVFSSSKIRISMGKNVKACLKCECAKKTSKNARRLDCYSYDHKGNFSLGCFTKYLCGYRNSQLL